MSPALDKSSQMLPVKGGMKIAVIIPAAGQGKRLKTGKPKPLVLVSGRPLLAHTLLNLKRSFLFHEIIVVAATDQIGNFKNLLNRYRFSGVRVVAGGRTRAESVRNGLENVSGSCEWILVHDAARPLVNRSLIRRLIQAAKGSGAAVAAMPVTSTVKRIDAKHKIIMNTEDRESLYLAQTPQIFKKTLLRDRYKTLGPKAFLATDEASLFDDSEIKVKIVPGDERNIKITTPEDMKLLKFYLKKLD